MLSKDLYIEGNHTTGVVKALASKIRIRILELLSEEDMNVQRIANKLGLSKTSVLAHINILEEAGFIESKYISGSVGNQRVCRKVYNRLIFNFSSAQCESDETYYESKIPVGNYFDFVAYPPCGLIRSNSIIKKWDDPAIFCDHERIDAVLVWAAFGHLEYIFPVDHMFDNRKVKAVKIDMELSANAFIKEHAALQLPRGVIVDDITEGISDITFWVNGIEVGTHTISAGLDREKALYTPSWWQSSSFLHGEMVRLTINETGCFIGSRRISESTYDELAGGMPLMRLRLGIKLDSPHKGGFAIFGEGSGRYFNGILVKTYIE